MKKNDFDTFTKMLEQKTNEQGKKIEIPDESKKALKKIQDSVNTIISIDNWDNKTLEDEKKFNNALYIMVPWFDYLKREQQGTEELEKAKKIIMSISDKHKNLYDWCKEYIEEDLEPYKFSAKSGSDYNKHSLNIGTTAETESKEKIIDDMMNEAKSRLKNNNHIKSTIKKISNNVNSYNHNFYYNKTNELKVNDKVTITMDRNEVINNLNVESSEEKIINYTVNIAFKGHFICNAEKMSDQSLPLEEMIKNKPKRLSRKERTFIDYGCPYTIKVDYPTKDIVDVNDDNAYVRFHVMEQAKHRELGYAIEEQNLEKYEELAKDLLEEANSCAEEERLALMTVNICKKKNINEEPFEDILTELYQTSKFGKEVIENISIPDDNTGNPELDRKKRKINELKEEILHKLTQLEDEEFDYQKKLNEFKNINK